MIGYFEFFTPSALGHSDYKYILRRIRWVTPAHIVPIEQPASNNELRVIRAIAVTSIVEFQKGHRDLFTEFFACFLSIFEQPASASERSDPARAIQGAGGLRAQGLPDIGDTARTLPWVAAYVPRQDEQLRLLWPLYVRVNSKRVSL